MSSDPHAYATTGLDRAKRPHACVLTIFGASGDLTKRKLIPGALQSRLGKALAGALRSRRLRAQRNESRRVPTKDARDGQQVLPNRPQGRVGLAAVRLGSLLRPGELWGPRGLSEAQAIYRRIRSRQPRPSRAGFLPGDAARALRLSHPANRRGRFDVP